MPLNLKGSFCFYLLRSLNGSEKRKKGSRVSYSFLKLSLQTGEKIITVLFRISYFTQTKFKTLIFFQIFFVSCLFLYSHCTEISMLGRNVLEGLKTVQQMFVYLLKIIPRSHFLYFPLPVPILCTSPPPIDINIVYCKTFHNL